MTNSTCRNQCSPLNTSCYGYQKGEVTTNHESFLRSGLRIAADHDHGRTSAGCVKVKNGNDGSVNVNRGGVKVQGGGGSKVKVNPGRNGSVNMHGPNGRGGSVSW